MPGLCNESEPELRLVTGDNHRAACHYAEELADLDVEALRASVDDAELVEADLGSDA